MARNIEKAPAFVYQVSVPPAEGAKQGPEAAAIDFAFQQAKD